MKEPAGNNLMAVQESLLGISAHVHDSYTQPA